MIDCLGVRVSQPTWLKLKQWFFETAQSESGVGRARSLYFVNAHTLNLAYRAPDYRSVLDRGDVVLNDGIGLDLYGRLAGASFVYNFNGTDLFPRLFQESDRTLRVFLYGAQPGRAERAKETIEATYPNVKIVGTQHGFTKEGVVEAINATAPDLLLVGMGNPRQEHWIDAHRAELDVGVVTGIGALIDFLSGAIPRAPELLRRARLEWAFRLALEPRRMFTRYVFGNPAFVARSVRYLAAGRARTRV